jgi:hypothetical protein
MVHRIAVCVVSCGLVCTAAFADQNDSHPHVRTSVEALRSAFTVGVRESHTFVSIVDQLDRGNVVVYLTVEPQQHGNGAHLSFMASAGGRRYLRISVGPQWTGVRLVALLGHELRHAAEVAAEPWVVDAASFTVLYERIGFPTCTGEQRCFDTHAAVHAGLEIAGEVAGALALQ